MLIDMHTHIFPEKIAASTLAMLAETCHTQPETNGMADGLAASAKEAGVDLSVILPIVTKPRQFESINRFASQFRSAPLLSFGGIHPASENYKEEIDTIKEMGFFGIKLHPDYQDMYFDDIRIKRVVAYACEKDLVVVTHAGVDPLCPEDVHCTPKMAHDFLHDVRPTRFVLAHMGDSFHYDEVEEYLLGEDVYMDTAVMLRRIPRDRLLKAIKAHGADKILFATDSPWSSQKLDAAYLRELELSEEEKEQIAWKNALTLLKTDLKTLGLA